MYYPKTKIGNVINLTIELIIKLSQWSIQICAIISLIVISLLGFKKIFIGIKASDPYELLIELVHGIELFFIAPIPILIVFSFRRYIIVLLDEKEKQSTAPTKIEKIFNVDNAKQSFVASLIGVTSTMVLGTLIQLLKNKVLANESAKAFLFSNASVFHLFSLIFLVILIFYYKVITKHIN